MRSGLLIRTGMSAPGRLGHISVPYAAMMYADLRATQEDGTLGFTRLRATYRGSAGLISAAPVAIDSLDWRLRDTPVFLRSIGTGKTPGAFVRSHSDFRAGFRAGFRDAQRRL